MQGWLKVAAASPYLHLANPEGSAFAMEDTLQRMMRDDVQVALLPELILTGASAQDLYLQPLLMQRARECAENLLANVEESPMLFAFGMPICMKGHLLDALVIAQSGKILAIYPRHHFDGRDGLADYFSAPRFMENKEPKEDEISSSQEDALERWTHRLCISEEGMRFLQEEDFFTPDLIADEAPIFELPSGERIAFTFAADLDAALRERFLREQVRAVFIADAAVKTIGSIDYKKAELKAWAKGQFALIYASTGAGESTTDMLYSGMKWIAEGDQTLAFSEEIAESVLRAYHAQEPMKAVDYVQATLDLPLVCPRSKRIRPSQSALLAESEACDPIQIENLPSVSSEQWTRVIDPHPLVPHDEEELEAILRIQALGLARRMLQVGAQYMVLGLSGGLDSALALLVCHRVTKLIPQVQIKAFSLPAFATGERTKNNSKLLAQALGVDFEEVDLSESIRVHLKLMGLDEQSQSVAIENAQARERTQFLMNWGNAHQGLLVGTGDMSEIALGWSTYNGDHMSMYGVNSSIPKTLVQALVRYTAEHEEENVGSVLLDILDTPISPELKKGEEMQSTEQILGPYALHDFFLYYFFEHSLPLSKLQRLAEYAFKDRYTTAQIQKALYKFFTRMVQQQFKRSCSADGVGIYPFSFSPRCGLRYPSDAQATIWESELRAWNESAV